MSFWVVSQLKINIKNNKKKLNNKIPKAQLFAVLLHTGSDILKIYKYL